jgi:hypothetical protein
VQLGEHVWVTEGHPIRQQHAFRNNKSNNNSSESNDSGMQWKRASELFPATLRYDISALYNFVTCNRASLVLASGHEASTLGQFCIGVDDTQGECEKWMKKDVNGSKLESFFGSERVIQHLKQFGSWPHVTLTDSRSVQRNIRQ